MLQIPFSGIKKVEEVVNSNPEEYISLSQGALKVGGIPQPIKQHLKGVLDTSKTDSYGSCYGLLALRQKIADQVFEQHKNYITASNVLITHGAIGALSIAFTSLLEPGDEVIIPEPAYPAYGITTLMCRAKPVYVSCLKNQADTENIEWHLDIQGIKDAATDKTRAIVFSNPSNPTGMVIHKSVILDLLDWCEKRGIYLIVDEAYRDFVFNGKFESTFSFVGKSEWLITINTFSKSMAMSGWRIGYLVAHEKLVLAIASIQDAMLNCLNNTAQYSALYALSRQDLVNELSERVKIAKDFAVKKLQPLLDKKVLSFNVPDGGFFLFAKVSGQQDTGDLCLSILNNSKLGVVPGKAFGPTGAPFIRICFARDLDVLQKGIERLTKFFCES